MGTYSAAYPDTPFDPEFKAFLENFYKTSDSPTAHKEYATLFTADATLIMASKKATGFEEIVNFRETIWSKVSNRAHHLRQVFPFGPNSNEFMLYGTVDYELKAGGNSSVEWGAHGILTKEDGSVKFSFYQVYLDSAAQNPSK